MKKWPVYCVAAAIILGIIHSANLWAQEIAISYPGLTGESASLWMAKEGGFFKENGIDAKKSCIPGEIG